MEEKGPDSASPFLSPKSSETATDDVPVRILLVEDNPGDVLLVREALKEHDVRSDIVVATDGEKALQFIENAEDGTVACPQLIILDLNLPRRSGHEVLRHLRSTKNLAHVTVVVLTSSDVPRDREETLRLGVKRYIRKPTSLNEFMMIGSVLREVIATEIV